MIGSGKSHTNLEAMSLNYCLSIVELDVISQFMQWINSQEWSEIKSGLKSNSVRSGQPIYEACDDNLDARI